MFDLTLVDYTRHYTESRNYRYYTVCLHVTIDISSEKTPVLENYVNVRDGQYSSFTIEFVDQNYRRINIKDPELLVILNFKLVKPEIGV